MLYKGEVLKQVDEIRINYQSGEYKLFANFDILMANIDKLLEYYDINDLWKKSAFGVNESLPYLCIYVLVVSCVDNKAIEELYDCEKYWNFVDNWLRENYDKYCNKNDECLYMVQKCAEEVSDSLKNEE